MKYRSLLLLSVAFTGLIAMSSCTKNYTCYCDITYTGAPGLPDSTSTTYSITDTKSGAKSKCAAQSDNFTNNNITTTETCYLY